MFKYLLYAAEEGHLEAMHELGNEYCKGEIVTRDYFLGLAWLRHACKNGYIFSYVY